MSRVRTTLRRVPLPLALLLGVAAVLSLSWSLATAPLQGPDESDHVGYVQHLAETGHIPSADSGSSTYATDEIAALGTGFLRMYQNRQARPPWSGQAQQAFGTYEATLGPESRKNGDGPNSVGKNPPLYYAYIALGWKLTPGNGFFGHLFVARAMGGLLLLAMVALSWLLAGEVFRRMLPRAVTAAVVALQPMAGFMSGIVNTDIMLATIWAAFLWLALRTVRLGLTGQRAAGLSAVAVLSVLTHGRGLAIVPPLIVALVVAWAVHHRTLRSTLQAAAGAGGTLVGGFVVYRVVASASGGGATLYGGEVNLGNQQAFNLRQLLSSVWQFYLPKLDAVSARLGPGFGYRQFYVQQYFAGVFSSFEVYFPYWVYDTVQVSVALLLLIGYTLGIIRWRLLLAHWPKIIILLATGLSMLALLHTASYRALANGGDNPLIAGRYLLALTPLLGIGIAAIVAALPRRAGTALAAVVCVGMLGLSLGGIALSVERFYA